MVLAYSLWYNTAMDNDLAWSLMKLWVLWYSSAAFVGAFLGVSSFYGLRALYRKLKKKG